MLDDIAINTKHFIFVFAGDTIPKFSYKSPDALRNFISNDLKQLVLSFDL